jgi:membrane-bound inhibitor of C-type lysozyme
MKKFLYFVVLLLVLAVSSCCRKSNAIVFKQVVSASGAKYETTVGENKLTIWNKGDDWSFYKEKK